MIHLTSVFICLNCPRAHWKWNAFCSCTLEATVLKQNSLRIIYKASCEKWQIYEILLIFWQRSMILRKNFFSQQLRRLDRIASCFVTHSKQTPRNQDDFITFDGKEIHDAFTGNKELRDKLVIVFFTDWETRMIGSQPVWMKGEFSTCQEKKFREEILPYTISKIASRESWLAKLACNFETEIWDILRSKLIQGVPVS